MLKTVQNLLRLKPWYVTLYVVLLGLLISSSYLEYRSRYRDLLQLVQSQAAMTAAVIAQSGSGQAFLTEELKQSYIDRAIDLLSIVNLIDAQEQISTSKIEEMVNAETNLQVTIYNKQGQIEHAAKRESPGNKVTSQIQGSWIQAQLAPIFSGETDLIIVGIDQDPVTIASRTSAINRESDFLVAIARNGGGALACHLTVEAEADFKYLTAMETALEELLGVNGLQYLQLAIDNREPYYVSKDSIIIDSSWVRESIADILYKVTKGDNQLLEVVRPVFFNSILGEVRIGFKADTLLSLQGQVIYQILIRTALLTILAFVTLIFLLTRQNEAFLKKEKIRIEGEVHRLERLNHLREKQAAMGELAAGVAHEIRNPLNAIGIVAQRLKREFNPTEDVEGYHSLTGTMVLEIGRINQSLQEFLEYTRPTPITYSQINMSEFLGQIEELYHSQALANHVKLKVKSDSIQFEADSEYLKQAISNLVKNALEACTNGGEVQISARRVKDRVVIAVEDNGIGIASDQLNRVFDLYYTTKDMGTGVGLALTHKIIADHHGSIEVKSETDGGSKFEIILPVKP
ncbi:MAG: GHKL domain-containing protein [Candidatus Marinimicrobia bacterium]|nr:GHKL domain-containing protein [Candidatus Neomarinimicrobiota bacterium]